MTPHRTTSPSTAAPPAIPRPATGRASAPAVASRRLRNALGTCRGSFAAIAAFSLAINLLMLVPSVYMLQIYDRVLASRNETTLLMLSLVCAGLFALLGGFDWLRALILTRVSARLGEALSRDVYRGAFASRLAGTGTDPERALGDLATLRHFLTGRGLVALFDMPWVPFYIAIVWLFDPVLGLLALGGTVLLFVLAAVNEAVSSAPLRRSQQSAAAASALAGSQLRNAASIAAMGMLPRLVERWYAVQRATLVDQALSSEQAAGINAVTRTVRIALQSAVLGLGALGAIEGRITPGMMIAASILVGRALSPVEAAIGSWRSVAAARGAWRRLDALLGSAEEARAPLPMPRPTGAVTVERLVVATPGASSPVLRGVSVEIPPGEVVAVVGPSGAGKSTFARALVGVWPAAAGAVRIDGTDLRHWDRDALGRWIGYLPQDVELFDGTVAENIARFCDGEPQEVIEAAEQAGVHELIQRLPRGYDTPVGEGGNALSAGQRQRVALARALYGSPSLVVLDEPNSNLDESGEAALVETLRRLGADGVTVVLVTHRRQVLDAVDRVLVMQDGMITQTGTARSQTGAAAMQAAVPARVAAIPVAVASAGTAGTLRPASAAGRTPDTGSPS